MAVNDIIHLPGTPAARIVYEQLVETVGVDAQGKVIRFSYVAVGTEPLTVVRPE